jgi:hypothetical protein
VHKERSFVNYLNYYEIGRKMIDFDD